jgi:hypothetical protein
VNSDWVIPIAKAAAAVIQNDVNPPTSAAASTGRMKNGISSGLIPVIGAMITPATPASPAPSAQVTVASTSGDQPSVATARWFSELARIASPIGVKRYAAQSVAVSPRAMTTM